MTAIPDATQAPTRRPVQALARWTDGTRTVLVVGSRSDAARLWLRGFPDARVRRGRDWCVVSPAVDITTSRVVDGKLVTPVPAGKNPWLHRGPTWLVVVPDAVAARLGVGGVA